MLFFRETAVKNGLSNAPLKTASTEYRGGFSHETNS